MLPPELRNPFRLVGIYCRVSSHLQPQLESIANQASNLLQKANKHRGWLPVDIYLDFASGSHTEREQFQRMLRDIYDGKINTVYVKSVSRLARNTADFLITTRSITEAGAEIVFDEEQISSADSDFEFIATTIAAVAQEENRSRSENIKWGIRRRMENGTSGLYRRAVYGYRLSEDGILEIVPEQAHVVRLIFALYLDGYSISGIIKELAARSIPSPTGKERWYNLSIDTMLSNEKYRGNILIGKTYFEGEPRSKRVINKGQKPFYLMEGAHAPIISQEMFDEVQEEKKRRSNIRYDEDGKPSRKEKRYHSGKKRVEYKDK